MISWLKYFPLDLRDSKEGNSVRGPEFSSARSVKLDFMGNILRLRAPRHRSNAGETQIYIKGMKADLANQFQTWHGATENWEYSTLLYRNWDYWREWFRGLHGSLTIHTAVLTRKEGRSFEGSSFFYPGAFEFAIANFLNTMYGVQRRGTAFTERAPINWQPHYHLPVFSCSFELWQGDDLNSIYFFFPLTDQHLGVIDFSLTVSGDEPVQQARKLVTQIINSVQLELSIESQAQLQRVKQEAGELKLSETFAPLKWPIEADDIEKPLAAGALLFHE